MTTFAGGCQSNRVAYLGTLAPTSRAGEVRADRSAAGSELNIGGLPYAHGLGVRGASELIYDVRGEHGRFEAWVGLDAASGPGAARFQVYADDQLEFDSGPVAFVAWASDANPNHPIGVRVSLVGVTCLRLVVTALEGDAAALAADWADAKLVPPAAPEFQPRTIPPGALAPTPPMGWCSWNAFGPEISAQLIRETVDAIVASGLKDAGYVYVNLDDGWQGARGDTWNAQRFPSGMKALGDYIHAQGLKFGIYSRPVWVSGQEERVAAAFAAWGVDYLKYDFSDREAEETNRRMIAAVRTAGRPIVFNICEWGKNRPWEWGGRIDAQTWRATYDVVQRWYTPADTNSGIGLLKALDQTEALSPIAVGGRWNDPDMLVVGLASKPNPFGPALTATEERTQFGLWCLLAAPLLVGCDARNLDESLRAILTNREVIAIDQDPLGVPAWRARKLGDLEVWKKPLHGGDAPGLPHRGDFAVGLLNRGDQPATIAVRWSDLCISGPYRVRDLWARQDLGVFDFRIARPVASHELVLLRLTPAPK